MATTDEIRHRVEEADTARSARRSAAAQQVGELARRHAAIAAQLEDVERQLGDALAEVQDVIDIDELARFTDVNAADLTQWLTTRKTIRTKRKKPAQNGHTTASRGPSSNRTSSERASPDRTPSPQRGLASTASGEHPQSTAEAPVRVDTAVK